mmetsp:Transcript_7520/g.19024  ORF Transcript_7520/g.19024 Transcript_7520/m.19024 type:complete len:207 (-) Transcript_7520:526-1146(-)
MVLPNTCSDHCIPSMDEELGVACRAVLRGHNGRAGKLEATDLPELPTMQSDVAIGGEKRGVIASEDARALLQLGFHYAYLVADSPHEREAIERWEPLLCDAPTSGSQLLATPSLVVIKRVAALLACLLAHGPTLILLVALHVHPEAALRFKASFVWLRALVESPRCQLAALDRSGRRTRSRLFAAPRIAVATPNAPDHAIAVIIIL